MNETTQILHNIPVDELTGAIAVPIYQTSTFVQEAPRVNKGFDYSRSNNPTRKALEDLVAKLECGHAGFAYASGLAAVDGVLKLLSSGDEIIAVSDIYGGTFRSFSKIYEKFGITVNYVDTTDPVNVLNAITPKTKLIWLETPTNPTLQISDIKAICEIAHQYDILVCVDNTFASPVVQKPITLGADLVLHSATKYLAGHCDVIAGIVVTRTPELSEQIKFFQNAGGAVLGPFDSWLTIRGIQTLSLRIERQCENALKIAQFLENCPFVGNVFYPGLPSHPNHQLACQQQSACGAVISFSLCNDTVESAQQFVCTTQLFQLAESLGGVKSLLCHPASMTHKTIPRETRLKSGICDSLIRLSVGIEGADDLIEDLKTTFAKVERKTTNDRPTNKTQKCDIDNQVYFIC